MRLIVMLLGLLVTLQAGDTFYDIPKVLWTFWDTGFDSARLFTRMCINNMGHYAAASDWQFKFLSNDNYTQYISKESLDRLNRMYDHSQHQIGRQHWADLMRLFLIYENGGMWLDTNSFFIANLSWIQNIAQEKWVANRITPQPEIITFSLSSVMGGNNTILYDEKLASDVQLFPGIQIWSFISKPKSKFLSDVLERLEYSLGVKREILDHQTQKLNILLGREKDPYYITSNYAFQTVLQKKQRQLQASPSPNGTKYAVQHYQMWTIPAQTTIYGIFTVNNWFTFSVIGSLFADTLPALVQRHSIPAYFIKFNGGNYPHINNALIHHEFVSCLGIDAKIREGSVFEEFMMRHSQELPQIKHINRLNELGYLNGDCKHWGQMVFSYISKAKMIVFGVIAAIVGANVLLMWAVKRRIVENNKQH